mmetsp:Transcript_11842/g.30242  ORF Transcript_11842/g.30242 Transcript_11842/m.30242 type:complete len:444 (-) Transcript_11842:581-1912(-)
MAMGEENATELLDAAFGGLKLSLESSNETERIQTLMKFSEPLFELMTPIEATLLPCRYDKCDPFAYTLSIAVLLLVVIVMLICCLGVFFVHLGNSKYACLRRSSMVIISLAPFFAFLSWIDFTFPKYHEFLEIPGTYMEGLAIFSFYRIMVYMLGGEERCAEFLSHGITQTKEGGSSGEFHLPHKDALKFRCCLIPICKFPDGRTRMRWSRIMVAQTVIVRPIFLGANSFIRFFDGEGHRARAAIIVCVLIGMGSFVVAMMTLLHFYIVMRKPYLVVFEESREVVDNLKWKFLLMKALLFLIVLQNFIVNILEKFDVGMVKVEAWGGSPQLMFIRMFGFISIVEMLCFSIALRLAFNPRQHGSVRFRRAAVKFEHLLLADSDSEGDAVIELEMTQIDYRPAMLANNKGGNVGAAQRSSMGKEYLATIGYEAICPIFHLGKPLG